MQSKNFEDILEPRRRELCHYLWISREVNTVVAYKQNKRPTPESHKESVLQNIRIQEWLDEVSRQKNIPKQFLETQISVILDEIGYNKNLKTICCLALILIKICLKVCRGIYINTDSILHTKSPMGNHPVVFVPSHRSYADFILMSFACFTCDVEIPAIAAGMVFHKVEEFLREIAMNQDISYTVRTIHLHFYLVGIIDILGGPVISTYEIIENNLFLDFHGMWAMGSILRDTGAFFMRRSYNNDILYWTTFKQYINQLITAGELPIEFFIEGTRSRSNKSLMPKYGLLNMILKPLFLRQVPDIIFVPINISYERIMEEKLFSYELLGVPKPKESTSALFKSFSIVKESYGNIHLNFGQPISGKQFFGEAMNESQHSIGPIHQQELTDYEKNIIPALAHEIVYCQQKLSVLNVINLIAIVLNHNLMNCKNLLTSIELKHQVLWLKKVLENLGANLSFTNINDEVKEALEVHKDKIVLCNDKIDVVRDRIDLTNLNVMKLKAYRLSEEVMMHSVPLVMLCIYINPVLHYFVDPALIVTALRVKSHTTLDTLRRHFVYMRNLLLYEFVTYAPNIEKEFERALDQCFSMGLIEKTNGENFNLGKSKDLQDILVYSIHPFLYSYYNIIRILETNDNCDEKKILVEAQKQIVSEMKTQCIHPYCLNLDTYSHCLSALLHLDAVKKFKGTNGFSYSVNSEKLLEIKTKLELHTLQQVETIGGFFKHKL